MYGVYDPPTPPSSPAAIRAKYRQDMDTVEVRAFEMLELVDEDEDGEDWRGLIEGDEAA